MPSLFPYGTVSALHCLINQSVLLHLIQVSIATAQHSLCLFFFFHFCQNLRRMEGETQDPVKDLDELQNADWVRITFTYDTIGITSVSMC